MLCTHSPPEASTLALKIQFNVSSLTARQSSGITATLAHYPGKLQHSSQFHLHLPWHHDNPKAETKFLMFLGLQHLHRHNVRHRVVFNNGCLMTGSISQNIYTMANIINVTRAQRNDISMWDELGFFWQGASIMEKVGIQFNLVSDVR